MKKFFVVILALICILAFSSCNISISSSNGDQQGGDGNTTACQHTFGEWDTVSDAACDKDGKRIRSCTLCSWVDEEVISSDEAHTPSDAVTENEISSTCDKNGSYETVVYCAKCQKEISRVSEVVQKDPHQYRNNICINCDAIKPGVYSKGLLFISNGDGTCALSGIGTCTDETVIVPSQSPEGETVISVGDNAFHFDHKIKCVALPDTVTSVGDKAFASCYELETVIMSNNLEFLGVDVFSFTDLKTRDENGLSYIASTQEPYFLLLKANDKTRAVYEVHPDTRFIYDQAFSYCSNATEITFSDNVIGIGSAVFQSCSELISISLSQNITRIPSSSFSNCRKLESVEIPSGVTVIGSNAFSYCSALKNVTLPDTLSTIEALAFYFCSSITEITIPDRVTDIQHSAFSDCTKLTSVSLPKGITCIPNSLFSKCTALKDVELPDGITVIENYAFRNCTALEGIVIPASVKTIKDNAFANCSGLKWVRFEAVDGWQCFDVNTLMVDGLVLTDEAQNAQYVYLIYNKYKWMRG